MPQLEIEQHEAQTPNTHLDFAAQCAARPSPGKSIPGDRPCARCRILTLKAVRRARPSRLRRPGTARTECACWATEPGAPAADQQANDGRAAGPQQHARQGFGAKPCARGRQQFRISQTKAWLSAQLGVGEGDAASSANPMAAEAACHHSEASITRGVAISPSAVAAGSGHPGADTRADRWRSARPETRPRMRREQQQLGLEPFLQQEGCGEQRIKPEKGRRRRQQRLQSPAAASLAVRRRHLRSPPAHCCACR